MSCYLEFSFFLFVVLGSNQTWTLSYIHRPFNFNFEAGSWAPCDPPASASQNSGIAPGQEILQKFLLSCVSDFRI